MRVETLYAKAIDPSNGPKNFKPVALCKFGQRDCCFPGELYLVARLKC